MNITSRVVTLSSAVAYLLQIALALLMLRYFTPEDVGSLMVINQISFFLATLALAQAPLRLLAKKSISLIDDVRQAWSSSAKHFLYLTPITTLIVWFSELDFVSTLLWALASSFSFMTWMLAQSMRLRMDGLRHQIGVRVLPQFVSLLIVIFAILLRWNGISLLFAAFLGYTVGASWLVLYLWTRSYLANSSKPKFDMTRTSPEINHTTSDDRSTVLRFGHSLVEVSLATAMVVVWQRLFGAQETGLMAGTLKMMGFVPAVVHIAWAQVLLAQPHQSNVKSIWVGLVSFAIVCLIGFCCKIALYFGWLGEQWQGVENYLLPLALWQGSACVAAAFSHLPFQKHKARTYSWACIGATSLQGSILFIPFIPGINLTAETFIYLFSYLSSIFLLVLSSWIYHMSKDVYPVMTH